MSPHKRSSSVQLVLENLPAFHSKDSQVRGPDLVRRRSDIVLELYDVVLRRWRNGERSSMPVSYTHLDVYKRQGGRREGESSPLALQASRRLEQQSRAVASCVAIGQRLSIPRPDSHHFFRGIKGEWVYNLCRFEPTRRFRGAGDANYL